jgi:hypothetical protein
MKKMKGRTIETKVFVVLGIAIGCLMGFDVISTTLILSLGGMELNPIMAYIVESPFLHLGLKIAVAGVFIWMGSIAQKKAYGSGYAILCAPVLMYSYVGFNNLSVLWMLA